MQSDSTRSPQSCRLCGIAECNHWRANRSRALDPESGSTILRNCNQCGAEYYARVRTLRIGMGLYCGKSCSNASRKIHQDQRAWAHVQKLSAAECWPSTHAHDKDGYPLFTVDGGRQRVLTRVLWELVNGRALRDHEKVCHTCDHPWCCNPGHWFIGTHADNHADRNAKGRQARGERIAASRLPGPEAAIEIRTRYAAGEAQQAIADDFGISQVSVSAIVRHKTWKHVE